MHVIYLTLATIVYAATDAHARWMDEIPNAPPRWRSKLFGIPTWIIPIKDYSDDAFNTTTVFSVVVMAAATFSMLYYIFVVHLPSQPRGQRSIGRLNTMLIGYSVATLIASFTFCLMWAGKVWASFGVFHNLFEIGLLAVVLFRRSHFLFIPLCFLYLTATAAVVIAFPWPLDALFFKFQGLTVDLALSIDLFRLYWHNRTAEETAAITAIVDFDQNGKGAHRLPPVHANLLILAIAATLHFFGNALVTIGNHIIMWLIFQFLYGVSFPMYAYYVVSEPNDHRIRWYRVSFVKEVMVMVISVVVCGLMIVAGIIVEKRGS